MKEQQTTIIEAALRLARETRSDKVLVFLNSPQDYQGLQRSRYEKNPDVVPVLPRTIGVRSPGAIFSWAGNQSRFSRIKYAFLRGVLQGIISTESRVVCVLGPWGRSHLDTITVHDLGLSWSEEFPFDPRALIANEEAFETVMAVVDVALDIGALGREGKSVGTTFVVGDTENVMNASHQAVFNPFKGYPEDERLITRSEVVESVKELAKLDGAFVVSPEGVVEAAGRHLDARSVMTKQLRGLGSRHRAAAGISRMTRAVSVVVSESSGRVTLFEKGHIVASLEPVISRRLE